MSKKPKYVNSPFVYTGNKYNLLPKLLPLFPDTITHFYDAFCGGLTVSLNVTADKITVNDVASRVISIYHSMQNEGQLFMDSVQNIIDRYGVTPDAEEAYLKLRDDYNKTQNSSHMLFALIATSYNSLIRFNSEGEYNAPFGFDKNYFNERKKERLSHLVSVIKDFEVINGSYADLCPESGSFVYCDPPYLITNAAYNDGWNHVSEYELLRWLDGLDTRGIKFGLSNVLRHKGKYNRVLDDWSKKYNVHHLDHKYTTYANGDKFNLPTDEVFICNY